MPNVSKSSVRFAAVIGIALAGVLVTGCTSAPERASSDSSAGESGEGSSASEATPAPEASPSADADGYPSCDEVKAVMGSTVAGLVEIAASENGVSSGADGPALNCSWYTPEVAGASTDLASYGFISLGMSRDPDYTEESLEPLGWNVDDPRVAGIGAWAVKPGGSYDPAAQLDVTGVQVVRDGVVVVLVSGGAALQDVPQLASLTNEWALGAGAAAMELME